MPITTQDLNSTNNPTWCPGCGNFSIRAALHQAIKHIAAPLEDIVICYDIGCTGNGADFNRTYAIHCLHGRAIPPAVGVKCANSNLKVIVEIGDGGGYGEGLTHYLNEMRGNHDITVLVHDNHRYSLTTGQMSPTTAKGTKTKSTPFGSIERELNPIALAISNQATFVAREFAVDIEELTQTIVAAINHPGFAIIDILQPCLVFNPQMDANWYRSHTIRLHNDGYSITDKESAWKQSMRTDLLPLGIFWQDTTQKPYHQEDIILKDKPLVQHSLDIDLTSLIQTFQ